MGGTHTGFPRCALGVVEVALPVALQGEGLARLQLAEHVVGARNLEVARLFDIELLDHAIIDDHRETLAALAQAKAAAVGNPVHHRPV